MSTRSTTHFRQGDQTVAIIYRHSDGYPEGHGRDLHLFLDEIEANLQDTRFTDPSYLAAKLVVWLADKFNDRWGKTDWHQQVYQTKERFEEAYGKEHLLNFRSIGVVMKDPGDIEYRYVVECDGNRPTIRCFAVGDSITPDEGVEIPSIEEGNL